MNTRKDFLVAGSLFALAPAVADAATPAPRSTKAPELTFSFDRAAFDRILAKQAKHKQCFGATKIEDGSVTNGMTNTMDAYEQYLGAAPGSVQTIAVLYHGTAIALAMNDAVWNTILFPSLKGAPADLRKDFADQKPGGGNPFKKRVAAVVARGSSFFVCHNAVAGFAGMAAGALKAPVQKIHDALMAGILPGALAVPAGVMAINAAQEAKFTYIQSSV